MKSVSLLGSMLLSAILLVILVGVLVAAQSGYSVNDQIAKLKTELNLDQAQSRKVALLLIKMDEKQAEDSERFADDPEAARKTARKRRDKINREMKVILDSGQFEKYEKMKFRSSSDRTPRQIKSLTEALSLTEAQIASVTDIYERYQPEFDQMYKAFRSDENSDRQTNRKRMGELRAKMATEIEALLTEDQVQKYQKYQENNRSRGRRSNRQSGGQGH